MATSWIYAILSDAPIETSFLQLGIELKLKVHDDIWTATFLKGMWYRNTQAICWGPLPSRFIKIGSSHIDPRITYKMKNPTHAAQRYLYDVAGGYSYFLQIPLIRKFVTNYFDGDYSAIGLKYRPQFSVQGTRMPIVFDAWDQLYARYGISREEFERVENLIPTCPFYFIYSPIFYKMAAVDYN